MSRVVSVVLSVISLGAVVALAQRAPSSSQGQIWVQLADGGWVDCDNAAAVGHPGCPSSPLAIGPTPSAPPLVLFSSLDACLLAQPAAATPLDLLKACGHLLGVPLVGCEHVNAYTEPDRANECAKLSIALNPPTPRIREFPLGAIFGRPYGERRIVIVGRALGLDGVEIITAQVVVPAAARGEIVAFTNDGGLESQQWWPALNGGGR